MSKQAARFIKKPTGFSLLELMVVVAILGVLATVAVPRFNIFRARARQAEAKSNLGVVFTLQEAFAIDHERHYNGNGNHWGGTDMKDLSSADGYAVAGGSSGCAAANIVNKLGFRLANCDQARYGYYVAEYPDATNETQFLAIAYAPSDSTAGKRIFPGCDGAAVTRAASNPTTTFGGVTPCDRTHADAASSAFTGNTGDAWCMDDNRNLHNYWDVVAGCEE